MTPDRALLPPHLVVTVHGAVGSPDIALDIRLVKHRLVFSAWAELKVTLLFLTALARQRDKDRSYLTYRQPS